jgi:hypothetical protein
MMVLADREKVVSSLPYPYRRDGAHHNDMMLLLHHQRYLNDQALWYHLLVGYENQTKVTIF